MAKSQLLNFTQNINLAAVTIVAADTTTLKTVYTGSANDAIIKGLNITSDDTAARVVNITVHDGTADRQIISITIPAASGTNGLSPSVDALSTVYLPSLPLDNNGKRVLPIKTGHILKVASQSTVTAAKTITVSAIVEEY